MLDDYLYGAHAPAEDVGEPCQIADETVDLPPMRAGLDARKAEEYLDSIRGQEEKFPVEFAAQYTKILIARALADLLWRNGTFRLKDTVISLHWRWNGCRLGNMAAFYSSVQAACECADGLGLRISSYDYAEAEECYLTVTASVIPDEESPEASLLPGNSCKGEMTPDPGTWIVYVPLDDGGYRLGGSLLSQVTGAGDAVAPELYAPDYFIDCYEVLREMVEDGVFLSARTVSGGGLIAAAEALSGGFGVSINISELMRAQQEEDAVRILFAEVPGVVFQIRDEDFDYIDAEFTLQEVMFFPLGHPEPGGKGVKVETVEKNSIQSILEALIRQHPLEGED